MAILAVLTLVVAGGVVWSSWYFSSANSARRALRAAPRVQIADFPEGVPARIVGRIADGDHLTAPLTGRACVVYQAIVQQYANDRDGGSWRTILRETRHVPFAIEDGTGRALVDPTGADLVVEIDSTTQSGTFDDATAAEADFLARHGLTSKGSVFNKRLRYREGALELGETIAVYGFGTRELDPDGAARATAYRDAPPMVLRVSSSWRQPLLLISDYDDTTR